MRGYVNFTVAFLALFLFFQCDAEYQRCGGILTESRGVIQSPNFPGPFKTPVFCEWVIQAQPKQKIVLYFTQYHLKGYFHVYEYDHYTNKDEYIGERKLATVNCEDEIWSIVAHKPFMVIRFSVQEMGNIHLRVLDHLIDVYGFNITYELENKHEVNNKLTCSVFECSYLGNCYASADFSEYKCHCFPNFFGDVCQYGPHCNPMIGKNMCQNNGSCRYLLGDYVNICDCMKGYYGSMCESKADGIHPSALELDYYACAVLDCEQTCLTTSTSKAACGCNHGFRLSSNNRTCIHLDHHKYDIRFLLMNTTTYLDTSEIEMLKDKIVVMFEQRGVFSIKNMTARYTAPVTIDIALFIESTDRGLFESSLNSVLELNNIIQVDLTSIQMTSAPELFLQSATMRVDSGSGLAALEHKGMTLSCAARGPDDVKFNWYKDGYPLDLRLFMQRAQETLIPSSRDGILRSVITFDRVSPLDRGTFTCEVSDGHRTENKSVHVNVLTVPLVDLYPLSISVVQGDRASIICMSPEDTAKNFTYVWHTNGITIYPGRSDQIVEDLFPTGTRLFVPNITKSANFSCTVANKAGAFTLTSHVFVQKAAAANLTCGRNYHKQVLWKKTAGNSFDKQRCPAEFGDFSRYGPSTEGYSTRHCLCNGEICSWAEPNFAKCQSVYLVYEVYDKLEMLRLGYQQTTIKYVYDRLREFIIKRRNHNLYSGDIELAVSILHDLLRHLDQYPPAETEEKISLKSLVELMSIMLTAANQSTWEEKRDMKAAPYFLRICQIIASGILPHNTDQTELTNNIITPNLEVSEFSVITELTELNNSTNELGESTSSTGYEFDSLEVISFTNKAILTMLAAKEKQPVITSMKSLSNVHSIFPVKGSNIPDKLIADIPVKPIIPLTAIDEDTRIVCVSWEFNEREPQYGRWTEEKCIDVRINEGETLCRCSLPGHFMVISIPKNVTVLSLTEEYNSYLPLMTACIVNIIVLGMAMFLFVIRKMWLLGDEYPLHFSILFSLLFKSVIFLVCLKKEIDPMFNWLGTLVVYFFLMAAFSSSFAESMHIYLSTGRRNDEKKHCFKYLLIAWGIPATLTVFFGVASKVFPGKVEHCNFVCWIRHGQWHFYGFIVPIIALDVAVLTMLIFALRSCLKYQDEARYTPKSAFSVKCLKTLSILVLLNITGYCSVFIHDDRSEFIISYSVVFCFLVLVVFVARCLCDRKIMTILWRGKHKFQEKSFKNQMERNQSNGSFKAYMKPELVKLSLPERKGANKHYDQVNRMKFTDERKRQLSDLLGSSQAGEFGNHDNHSIRGLHHDNGASDSGIFGSDNERFLNNVDFEPSNSVVFSNRTIAADVHVSPGQNDFVVHPGFSPFPELAHRNACKELLFSPSRTNGFVRPKFTYVIDSKENRVISESGESTTMLLLKNKDDQSDGQDSDSN